MIVIHEYLINRKKKKKQAALDRILTGQHKFK